LYRQPGQVRVDQCDVGAGFARAALDMAAEMSGWGTPLPRGKARAIALEERGAEGNGLATITAMVHTVSVSRKGKVRLENNYNKFPLSRMRCHLPDHRKAIPGPAVQQTRSDLELTRSSTPVPTGISCTWRSPRAK
jgi:hypothetical protein